MTDYKVCKICIMKYGLTGQSLADGTCKYAFETSEELIKHLKKEHNIKVKTCKCQCHTKGIITQMTNKECPYCGCEIKH